MFDELSQSGFNFGESKSSTDSSNSTKANSFVVDTTYMEDKFAMIEETIEALEKFIDDKNLEIAQLMSKLDLYNCRESHHNLKTQEKVDIDFLNKSVDSQIVKQSVMIFLLSSLFVFLKENTFDWCKTPKMT